MLEIVKAKEDDLEIIHKMKYETFKPLLEKYKDYDISPACESFENLKEKYNQTKTTYWLIKNDNKIVGAFRIVDEKNRVYKISPIFIHPNSQDKGLGQKVFKLIEDEYSDAKKYFLLTILEEKRNCHFYEKLGYKAVGENKKIKEGMTIVYYEKIMQ